MPPRSKRLSRASFPKIRGNRAVFAYGSVAFFPGHPLSVAVVVSKKTFKSSVLRHRVKRRVLNALKRSLEEENIGGGIIVYPTVAALSARFSEMEDSLGKTILKLSKKQIS